MPRENKLCEVHFEALLISKVFCNLVIAFWIVIKIA